MKVNLVKEHKIIDPEYKTMIGGVIKTRSILVTEGELILVEYPYNDFPNKAGDICRFPYGLNIAGLDDMGYNLIKPIFISRNENIEIGDWVFSLHSSIHGLIFQVTGDPQLWSLKGDDKPFYKKIISLREYFAPEHLQMIVDGKLKHGDKVLIECEKHLSFPSGKYHWERGEHFRIKLNPQITIYPIEERMVPLSLVENAFYTAHYITIEAISGNDYEFDSKHYENEKKKWFNDNLLS